MTPAELPAALDAAAWVVAALGVLGILLWIDWFD